MLVVLSVVLFAVKIHADNVELTSNKERQFTCPGDQVTFTCRVFRSDILEWRSPLITQRTTYTGGSTPPDVLSRDPFIASLINVNGNTLNANFTSTLQVNASRMIMRDATTVTCLSGAANKTDNFTIAGLPSPPQTLSYHVQQYGWDSVTLTVQWQPPQYDGGAPVNYTITVSPDLGTFTTSGTSIMVTAVPYNVMHNVSIVATNCNGSSSATMETIPGIVDCGPAIAPQRGSTNYTNTTEGSLVFYSCDPGLVPEGRMNATCTDSGWSPNPTGLNCTEGLSGGAVAGIVIGVIMPVLLIAVAVIIMVAKKLSGTQKKNQNTRTHVANSDLNILSESRQPAMLLTNKNLHSTAEVGEETDRPTSEVGEETDQSTSEVGEETDRPTSQVGEEINRPTSELTTTKAVTEQALVIIGDETFSLTEIPPSGALVEQQRNLLLGYVDLQSLVTDLDMVGYFLRIAYNGVVGFTELQIKIRAIGYDLTKLYSRSAGTVAKFKQASVRILSGLQCTYHFLVEAFENVALETLSKASDDAKEMAAEANTLHKDFEKESECIEEALKCMMRTKGSAEERKELKLKSAEFEITKVWGQEDKKTAEQDYELLVKKYEDAEAIDPLKALQHTLLSPFTRGEQAKSDLALPQEAQEQVLKHPEEMRKQRLCDFKTCTENYEDDSELPDIAVDALHEAMSSLKKLSVVMLKAFYFWKQMQVHCEQLAKVQMKNSITTAMKMPKEDRIRMWTSQGFKKQVVEHYAQWVALGNVCDSYMVKILETQKDLYKYLQENPTRLEAIRTIRELAIAIAH